MKTYKNLTIDSDRHLGFLTLNRQKENNSLNIETSKEIYEGLKELEMNSSIRVILIQGNRKFFSPDTCLPTPGPNPTERSATRRDATPMPGVWGVRDKR